MAFLSLKSNALEPTRAEYRAMSAGAALRRRLTVYGLPLLTVVLIIFFSLLLPKTFPTALNFHSMLDDKSVIALLSLASIIPMMAGRIDLTVGYGIILWHVMAIGLQVWYGIPWPIVVVLVLIAGMLLGFLNAMLVEIAQIDSFIATLGTGTIIYAIALWVTGGQQVIGTLPRAFLDINDLSVFGLPIGAFYVAVVAIVLWIVSERLPIGRHLYTIGANPRAAELNGIPVRRYVMSGFLASGFLTAFAGVVLAARLRIGETSVGLEYLLPALVGAFLGSTTIKPGRVNVWGTVVAVIILAVGIAGIEQLGGSFFVEPMFNGVTLVIAIGLAGITQRRAAANKRAASKEGQFRKEGGNGKMKRAVQGVGKGPVIGMLIGAVALGAAVIGVPIVPARADDAFVQMAKKFTAKVTSPQIPWTGPTTGPKAVPGKFVIYVSTDQRNGGPREAGLAAAEAAKVIGWKYRILDGRGTVSGQNSALSQAIALKPNGIILGGIDAVSSAPLVDRAEKLGIKVVGWHAGPAAGVLHHPNVLWNVSTDPAEVSKAAALYAVATSDGHAGVVIFTDSEYALAVAKSNGMADWIKKCSGCKILATEDTPLGQTQTRMPQLTTSLLERFGKAWTYSLGINDLYYDFMGPSLQAAGIKGNGHPWNISGGDGSSSAFQRIRTEQYQVATVAEPLHMQGWQLIDELNRAFAGDPPSGFVDPVHLFIHANIKADGGDHDVFDPANGYEHEYRKIWGK